jgi:hypothetical protein
MTAQATPRAGQLPPLLFGDNQFFGVNHMSEDKARARQLQFQRVESVMSVLDAARDEGITTFMCTTHDRVAEICDIVRAHPDQYPDMVFHPCMPYAHKYANAVTEDGFLGAVRRFMPSDGLLDAAVRGTRSLAAKDVEGIATLLVDAELKMFEGLRTPVVWMQNVIVDLLLGLGFLDAFRMFADHVRERHGAEPGFITMNLPALLDALEQVGVENPLVCSNINKLGFRMSGGVEGYLTALEDRPFRAVAMSVFASGAIPADEAVEWVCGLPNVESIVFGASTRAHIADTRRLVGRYWGDRGLSGGLGTGNGVTAR